jgi:excisionase family DNA binding protein
VTEERYLTAAEVAGRYRLSVETIQRWAGLGKIPAIRLPGTARGRLRFVESRLEAWEAEHEVQATPVREAPTPHSDVAGTRLPFAVPTPSPQPTAASTEEEPSDATR